MSLNSQLTINDLPIPALLIDSDGYIKGVNDDITKMSGYTEKELIDYSLTTIFPFSLKQGVELDSDITSLLFTLAENNIELVTKKNQRIDGHLSLKKSDNNFILAIFQSHAKTILESDFPYVETNKLNSGEALWSWDLETNIIHYSEELRRLLGCEDKSFVFIKSFWEAHTLDTDLPNVSEAINQHLSGITSFIDVTYSLKSNALNDLKKINVVGKICKFKGNTPTKVVGFIKDMGTSNEPSLSLNIEQNYVTLDEKINPMGHWRLDVNNSSISWSAGMYAIHGVNSKNFSPDVDKWLKFYIEKDQIKVKELLKGAISKSKGFYFKSTIITHSNKKLKIECLGKTEKNNAGNVIGLFGVFQDITKREETFAKLKLLSIANYTLNVPIFFIDEQDNVVYQDLTPQHDNNNSTLFNFINFSITEYLTFKKKAKNDGQIKQTNMSFDKYITVFDISVTYDDSEDIYIWIVENVTDKFRKEQQQIVSNRMALLGNTFGNVSHDINNVLGVALGATEMLELKVSKGEKNISDYIERVKNAIDKGKSVTERLLAFTKKPTINVVSFDPLLEIVENQHLFEQLLLTTIDFSYHFDGINCSIKFPQGEFINIILNLVLNAQDAIRENSLIGKIEVSANINEFSQLEIHINDSGIGIKDENLSRIFDPFYSSKSVNKGNGIGLANVYSTVYKHNGEISVDGHGPLGGAKFTLKFNAKVLSTVPVKETVNNIPLNVNEVPILILDDEVSIAEFVALYLDDHGAFTKHVSTKKDLIQALDCNQQYDIFITDMILPDISGRDAVELVLSKYPDIKVYSMSGYVGEEDNKWKYPVLRKPFNSDELALFLNNN